MLPRILVIAAAVVGVATEASVLRQLQGTSTIGDLIQNDPELTELAALLGNFKATEGGELDTIMVSDEMTLLAPTNAAFAAIANNTIAQRVLSDPGYASHLENLIGLHFAMGIKRAADLGSSLEMANGETVTVGTGPTLSGPSNSVPANVTSSDVEASNGVIHKIDAVLLPEFWTTDVVTLAETKDIESLSTIKTLFGVVKDDPMLSAFLGVARTGQVTMFAPTDTAFEELGPGAVDVLTSDTAFLLQVLQNHVVFGTVYPYSGLTNGLSLGTLRNGPVVVSREEVLGEEVVLVEESKLLDIILANNGIIYSMEEVFLTDEDRMRFEASTPEAPATNVPATAPTTPSTPSTDKPVGGGGVDPPPTIDIAPPPTETPVDPVVVAPPTAAPVANATTAPMTNATIAPVAVQMTNATKPTTPMPMASPTTRPSVAPVEAVPLPPPTAPDSSDAVMYYGVVSAAALTILHVLAH